MTDYNSFAPYYDLAMGDQKEVANALRTMIGRHHPGARTVLELGCGSGSLLAILTKYYTCSGVDLSAGMIRMARKKVPGIDLYTGDISKFDTGRKYDAVVCAFDTINHLPRFAAWENTFRLARRQLAEQGVFIFDVNTVEKIDRYHAEPPYVEIHEDYVTTFEVRWSRKPRYTVLVKVFRKIRGDTYRLHQMTVHGLAVPIERIHNSLKRYYSTIRLIDLERRRVSGKSDEVYFVCS